MATRQGFKSSFEKEFFYVKAFLSEPIDVEFPWGKERIEVPKRVNISDLLFERTYQCMDYFPCRKCCIGLWSMFLKGFTPKKELTLVKLYAQKSKVTINEKKFDYYCVNHKGGACPLSSETTGCTVHENNPITCMFPLVHFRQLTKDSVNILIGPFGRNWAMGCPVEFRPYKSIAEFNLRILPRFERMIEYLDYIDVPHKGKSIMDTICKKRNRYFNKPQLLDLSHYE